MKCYKTDFDIFFDHEGEKVKCEPTGMFLEDGISQSFLTMVKSWMWIPNRSFKKTLVL